MSHEKRVKAVDPNLEITFASGILRGSMQAVYAHGPDTAFSNPAMDGFLAKSLLPEAKESFVDNMRTDHALRLSVIERRRALMEHQGLKYPDEVELSLSHFRGFLKNCPGSSYVAGIEFRKGMADERQQRVKQTGELLGQLFRTGSFEDLALENAWRLAWDADVLEGISPFEYANGNKPLSGFLGAMMAIDESERGTYQTVPPAFIPPIS